MRLTFRDRRRGQALVLLALVIPLLLLPVAGYAVEAGYAASRAGLLAWACARAAEDAAQQVDGPALRAYSVLAVDGPAARQVARSELAAYDPAALVDRIAIGTRSVDITAHERVPATLAFWLPGALTVRTGCAARLAAGYQSPSS